MPKQMSFFQLEDTPKTKVKRKGTPTIKLPEGDMACAKCGLYRQKGLENPKLKPYGKFKRKGFVIGEGPGQQEDRHGKPFQPKAPAGKLLHKVLTSHGIDLYKDCKTVNATDCRPMDKDGNNRAPTKNEVKCCVHRKIKALEKYKPTAILLLGDKACESFYGFDPDRKLGSQLGLRALRGRAIPDKKTGAWVCHSYHPSFIKRGNEEFINIFSLDVAVFANLLKKPHKWNEPKDEIRILDKFDKVVSLLRKFKKGGEYAIDYETTSFRYHERIHRLRIVSIAPFDEKIVYVFAIDLPQPGKGQFWPKKQRKEIKHRFKAFLKSSKAKKVAHNLKHEQKAADYVLGVKTNGWTHCSMLATHVIDPVEGITGLKKQTYINYGVPDYSSHIAPFLKAEPRKKNRVNEIPLSESGLYCGRDSSYTKHLTIQQRDEITKRHLEKAYNLMHEGALAYSEVEKNGIKLDMRLAKRFDDEWGERLETLKEGILKSKEAKLFRSMTGVDLKFKKGVSSKDLQVLLFKLMKLKPLKDTKTGHAVDAETLEKYKAKSGFISDLLEYKKYDKLKNTYLAQFLRYEIDGFIYPSINLHFAESLRSSISEPSFQNIPKRDEESKVIRRIFVSRWGDEGYVVEVDYGSMEVRIIACVTHDPVLIDYIEGGGDMHGDWAEIIYQVKKGSMPKGVFKQLRQGAKNGFIFPNFYGSWWKSTASNLWQWMPEEMRGGWKYPQWLEHIKQCDRKFWKKFHVTREWQDKLVKEYKIKGFVQDSAWGFKRYGYLSRNRIYNFPIQGPAFHCLQWSINEIVLRRNSFRDILKSLLCGEIHDALYWDTKKKELPTLMKKVDPIMKDKIREENKWLIVPLETEWTKGKDWSKMEEVTSH